MAQTALLRWELVDKLRQEEGSSVEICADNPDFGGSNCAIYAQNEKTHWLPRVFYGDTIDDCLRAAVKEFS